MQAWGTDTTFDYFIFLILKCQRVSFYFLPQFIHPYLSLARHQLGSDISRMVYSSSFFSSRSIDLSGWKLYSAITVMPTDGPRGSGGSGGKRRLGVSCNSRSWISSVRSVVMSVSISIPTMRVCHLCWSGREGLPGWPPLFRREPCERHGQSFTFR